MPLSRHARAHLAAAIAYLALAIAFSWPLPARLATELTGSPTDDTGVYIWNIWVYRHELLQHHLPYFTNVIFGPHQIANLSLHNYTPFQDLIAVPLIGVLGVVVTFNVIYLLMIWMTACAGYLLARRVTGASVESWVAGALFAWSPFIVTRGMAHFSLIAAAPLAIFLLLIDRAAARPRVAYGVALGVTLWWAAGSDAYYAVYCLMLGAAWIVARLVVVTRDPARTPPPAAGWALDVLMGAAALLTAWILATGGWAGSLLGVPLRMRTVYTPVLVLTVLAAVRLAWPSRASLRPVAREDVRAFVRVAGSAIAAGTLLLLPRLYAVGVRVLHGHFDLPATLWRSSPPGVDALALVLPNPNHPLAPHAVAAWLTTRPNGYFENVASIPWVAIVVLAVAWWRGWKAPRWWVGLAVFFGLLALGPFIVIDGLNTHVPGPWAFLRYVPVVSLARTPARFTAVLVLAISVLVACALTWIGRQYPRRRRLIVGVVGALLLAELLPAPMQLYSAAIPRLYDRIAQDPDDVSVLELPFGYRDGASNVGDFNARTLFFQTAHGKTLMGGYLSRVSHAQIAEMRRAPAVNGLIVLSEGRDLSPADDAAFRADARAFVARERIRYVVVDRTRASDALRRVSVEAFGLTLLAKEGDFELYRAGP